jgi:uncharacterized protein (DUF58 family)
VLLSPEVRARLEQLSLVSRRRVRAQWAGRHASSAKGESLDFADYREYVPGDDFRRIDHNLWARLGQVLVRQFEAEEELPVRLVIDVSRSMTFYDKGAVSRTLAGMITYLALASGDRVIPHAVPGRADRLLEQGPTGRHLSAWPLIERWIESLPAGGSTPIAPVLRSLIGGARTRGSVVLVSDLLDAEWERALDGMGTGAGGIVIQVLGSEELAPELAGDIRLVDSETGSDVMMSTSEETMRAYRQALERFVEGVAGRARRAGLDYVLVPAGTDAADHMLEALATAGALR